jgi:hypothetical protein
MNNPLPRRFLMKEFKKSVEIIGGGTVYHVRNHLALCAPAYGTTARLLADLCKEHSDKLDVRLHLTKMADPLSNTKLETNRDVEGLVDMWIQDPNVKIVFFNVAMTDFEGSITEPGMTSHLLDRLTTSGKYETRLKTSEGEQTMLLTPAPKVLSKIRKQRKDIFLVGFKTTCGASENEQYLAGLNLLKKSSCNLVLANDTKTRVNMIITPEEARYHVGTDREYTLKNLVEMAYLRSHLSFTRSTVVAGDPVPWTSSEVPESLRTIVDACIQEGAYKPFNGATVGHFACKLSDTEFLTSRRKTNFNELSKLGLVRVKTDGPDSVIAYGSKPSVGGQSQRIIFNDNPDYDCIVHFHCPIKSGSQVPVVSQREYECGSHQCGENTSRGLKSFYKDGYRFSAVMLDNHGPNIVFNRNIKPQVIIDFIKENFDLASKTGGPVKL